MRSRVIAVDGQGGAGKTTFSRLLAGALGDAVGDVTIVQTDDFASWDHPIDWSPRLLDQVLEPLSRNEPARYQRYDQETRREWMRAEDEYVARERPDLAAGLVISGTIEEP